MHHHIPGPIPLEQLNPPPLAGSVVSEKGCAKNRLLGALETLTFWALQVCPTKRGLATCRRQPSRLLCHGAFPPRRDARTCHHAGGRLARAGGAQGARGGTGADLAGGVNDKEVPMKPMLIVMRHFQSGPCSPGQSPCRLGPGSSGAGRACPLLNRRRSSTLKQQLSHWLRADLSMLPEQPDVLMIPWQGASGKAVVPETKSKPLPA